MFISFRHVITQNDKNCDMLNSIICRKMLVKACNAIQVYGGN